MQADQTARYIPSRKICPTVKPGEFFFAAAGFDHGHIYEMIDELVNAGGILKSVYNHDPSRYESVLKKYPQALTVDCIDRILDDPAIHMVVSATIPCERGALGVQVMEAGKDFFVDKAPFTTLEHLAKAKETATRTGRKYMCFYSERLFTESGIYAGDLIKDGVIGDVVQMIGMGPHRLSPQIRADWFYQREKYGGILIDIGSHQVEQFLYFTNSNDATVTRSQIGNYNHPQYPQLDDFGDAMMLAPNGASGYFRVDWFTPDGLKNWGDGRTFLLGTKGYIELRKYINPGVSTQGNTVLIVTDDTEELHNVTGKVGLTYFGDLILDCLNRTENAMTQEHCFKTGELCVRAQMQAETISAVI